MSVCGRVSALASARATTPLIDWPGLWNQPAIERPLFAGWS
jgi:hypothetical protein